MFFLDAIAGKGRPWHHSPAPLPRWSSHWHPTIAHYNGTLQWHAATAPRPMAPYNGTTTTPPKLVVILTPPKLVVTLPPNHSTLEWHPIAPGPLPQSWTSPSPPTTPPPTIAHYSGTLQWQQWQQAHCPKVGRHPPPNHSTLQWQWHHVHSPKVGRHPPPRHSTLQCHPTMASNGTTSTAPCNGNVVPRPIRQSGSLPSPPIGSKNP